MNNKKSRIPEILAPAGSIEAFYTAINSGADAVYLGLSDFNARLRAKNFTSKTLSYLVPYAHSKNVKIYVTLNIQFKQSELEQVITTLFQLDQIGVDALIVADAGIIDIARNYFPRLSLHGSTQMAIHNSAGVRIAKKMGLKRVVLARELSLEEIASIKRTTDIELETFVHGALCYCISGNCLASSILGGASGNRGRCTQVCRRRFSTGDSSGYYFSPKDFCGIEYLKEYQDIGVSSLKIEGRMKGPEYVYTVVNAYKNALNGTDTVMNCKSSLEMDMGRPKTSFFLVSSDQKNIVNTEDTPGTGYRIGIIKSVENGALTIDEKQIADIKNGDRIRVQPSSGFEGVSQNIVSFERNDSGLILSVKDTNNIGTGDEVYLVSRKEIVSKLDLSNNVKVSPVRYSERYPKTQTVLKNYIPKISSQSKSKLWVKTDSPLWFDMLDSSPCQYLIYQGTKELLLDLLDNKTVLSKWRSRIFPSLPPYIPESEIETWKTIISKYKNAGINRWACTNIGQLDFFEKDTELVADNPIWVLNSAAQGALLKKGFSWFTYSIEDDYLNVKSIPSFNGIIYIFGHIPLFISRIAPAINNQCTLRDPYSNVFYTSQKNRLYYLLTEKPYGIIQRKSKLAEAGITNFAVDLCFCKPDMKFLSLLLDCYRESSRFPESELYNFKAGLK